VPTRSFVGRISTAGSLSQAERASSSPPSTTTRRATVHANGADETLVRLEGMALLAGIPLDADREQAAAALDLVVVRAVTRPSSRTSGAAWGRRDRAAGAPGVRRGPGRRAVWRPLLGAPTEPWWRRTTSPARAVPRRPRARRPGSRDRSDRYAAAAGFPGSAGSSAPTCTDTHEPGGSGGAGRDDRVAGARADRRAHRPGGLRRPHRPRPGHRHDRGRGRGGPGVACGRARRPPPRITARDQTPAGRGPRRGGRSRGHAVGVGAVSPEEAMRFGGRQPRWPLRGTSPPALADGSRSVERLTRRPGDDPTPSVRTFQRSFSALAHVVLASDPTGVARDAEDEE
jgi:hypothetical protein